MSYTPKRGKRAGRNTQNRHPARVLAVLIIVVAAVCSSVIISARYRSAEKENTLHVAQNVYFESDLLKNCESDGDIPSYTVQKGTDEICFTLSNFPDGLRRSELDISYTVTVTDENGNAAADKNGAQIPDQSGTLKHETEIDGAAEEYADTKTVTVENLNPGTYKVTAQSTDPYEITLSAVFVIPQEQDVEVSVTDSTGSPYVFVKVNSHDFEGAVVLTWPAAVVPDNADPMLRTATGTSYTVNLECDGEYVFRFYKSDTNADYSDSEAFTAEKSLAEGGNTNG